MTEVSIIPYERLPVQLQRSLGLISEMMAQTGVDPAIRFSAAGMEFREELTRVYEKIQKLNFENPESDKWSGLGVEITDLCTSYRKILQDDTRKLSQDRAPLLLLATTRGQEDFSSMLKEVIETGKKIHLTYPPAAVLNLQEGKGAIFAVINHEKIADKSGYFVSLNEIWDTTRREKPIFACLLEKHSDLVPALQLHIHFHDDDRFQIVFDTKTLSEKDVLRLVSALAQESLDNRAEKGTADKPGVSGAILLESWRTKYKGVQLVFMESY